MDIFEILQSPQKIVITSHQGPDGDAIGSSLALFHYLEKKGHHVIAIVPDDFPDFLKWMQGSKDVMIFEQDQKWATLAIKNADVIFSLDYNDLSRVGEMGELIAASQAYKVMIDHHLYPADFANWQLSDTKSCATAQLIFDFIDLDRGLNEIDLKIAEGIYTGILTDTGSFRFPSVDSKTHKIASFLLELGLQHAQIHQAIYDTNSIDRLKLIGFALNERLEILEKLPVAYISLSLDDQEKYNLNKGDTEGLVNYALSVQGVNMAVFIKETEGLIKFSFRSKGDIPVNEFATAFFNGGGHKNAAGGRFQGNLDDAKNLFLDKIGNFFSKIDY